MPLPIRFSDPDRARKGLFCDFLQLFFVMITNNINLKIQQLTNFECFYLFRIDIFLFIIFLDISKYRAIIRV